MRVIDGLGLVNSYEDTIDNNILEAFSTAMGITRDKGSVYSLKGMVNNERCASQDGKDNCLNVKIFFPRKLMVAKTFGVLIHGLSIYSC